MDCSYSVDMVTLTGRADNERFHDFILSVDGYNVDSEYYQNFNYRSYRHLWVMLSGESKLVLKYRLNSEKPSNQYKWEFEYNPNKVNVDQVYVYLKALFLISRNISTKRCDIACDLPVNILNVAIDKGQKHEIRTFSRGGDNLTYYIGTRNRHNDVKVYNKAREQAEHGKPLDGDLTRYEITLEVLYALPRIEGEIKAYCAPVMLIYRDLLLTDQSIATTEEILLLEGLRNRPDLFNSLSAYRRRKLKNSDLVETFAPDESEVRFTLAQYLYSLKSGIDDAEAIPIRHTEKIEWEQLIHAD